jgi:hypothetical protein
MRRRSQQKNQEVQAAGLYIDRKEILHGKIDQMSKEEVLSEIKRIQQEYPALIEATSPAIEMDNLEVLPDGDKET